MTLAVATSRGLPDPVLTIDLAGRPVSRSSYSFDYIHDIPAAVFHPLRSWIALLIEGPLIDLTAYDEDRVALRHSLGPPLQCSSLLRFSQDGSLLGVLRNDLTIIDVDAVLDEQ